MHPLWRTKKAHSGKGIDDRKSIKDNAYTIGAAVGRGLFWRTGGCWSGKKGGHRVSPRFPANVAG
ncbi:hypothetical protein [Sphingobacterium suaedae]|uniref:Uncharacterized protein n=1 Tax=Sphingobacterium suaedae TaxID=1686402 RepID=A0ABW5KEH0_9SPHI